MTGRIFDGGWQEDQEVCSDTDSDITAGTYAGLHGYHNISSYEDWSAADLAAGPTQKSVAGNAGRFAASLSKKLMAKRTIQGAI